MKRISLLLILLIPLCIYGHRPKIRNSKWEPQIVANYKYGFLVPHSASVKALTGGMFSLYELGVEFPYLGNASFKRNYPFHRFGIVTNFSPLSNPELLGYEVSLMPYLDMNLITWDKASFKLRIGSGLGYIQKPFDLETNYKNLVIGSHINNITDFQIKFQYQLTAKTEYRIGFGLQHFSNGSYTRPNLGLNILNASAGVKYNFRRENRRRRKGNRDTVATDSSRFFALINYGAKNLDFQTNNRYHVINAAGGYSFALKKQRYIHLRLDVIYDESIPYLKDFGRTLQPIDNWIVGLFATYEKRFANLGLFFGSGYYIHSIYETFDQDWSLKNKGGNFYNRVGAKVYFDNIYITAGIKTHTGEADNIEIGIGYRFKK